MIDLFDIRGKKAIVTGAGSGMGNAIATAYAKAGASVAFLDMKDEIFEIADRISKEYGVEAIGIKADLSVSENRKKAFDQAFLFLGGIDVLVNCAGIQFSCDIVDFPLEKWQKVLDVNLSATFELCQLAGKKMIEQKSGKIINFASMLSFIGGSRVPAYSASKGAVMQITKTMSNDWAKYGICVNAIAPGYIDTPLNTDFMLNKERSGFIMSRIPSKRWGKPEDVTGLAIMLASKASDYITGAIIPVDGGFAVN